MTEQEKAVGTEGGAEWWQIWGRITIVLWLRQQGCAENMAGRRSKATVKVLALQGQGQ